MTPDQAGHGAKDAAPTPFQFLHIATLREYSEHPEEILRESCWVALMWLE